MSKIEKMRKQKESCDFCGNEVVKKRMTIDFHYKGKLIIIENVPVKVCVECKERYYDAHVWEELERIARSRTNVKKEIKVPVKEYELERI